jgi:hypothetical protein
MKVVKKHNSTSKTRSSANNWANGKSTASYINNYRTGVTKKSRVSKEKVKRKSVSKKSKTRTSKEAAKKKKHVTPYDYKIEGSEHEAGEVYSMEPRFETESQSSSKSKPVLTKIKGKE